MLKSGSPVMQYSPSLIISNEHWYLQRSQIWFDQQSELIHDHVMVNGSIQARKLVWLGFQDKIFRRYLGLLRENTHSFDAMPEGWAHELCEE